MRSVWTVYVPAALFVATSVLLLVWSVPIEYLADIAQKNTLLSHSAFVALLVSATVFAPVTVMPVIPMVAPMFGPFVTGVLSIIGWSLGGIVAFLISRHVGRPLLTKFVSVEHLEAIVSRIPTRVQFFTIILIRMSMPVDITSYALGLVQSVSFTHYTLATIIGVSWFSFAFAYLGDALFQHHWSVAVWFGSSSLVLLLGSWYILLRHYTGENMTQGNNYKNKK